VTVSHPDDLKFDINGVQEVTVRVLPPSGKVLPRVPTQFLW
jgi:hypothetical protein